MGEALERHGELGVRQMAHHAAAVDKDLAANKERERKAVRWSTIRADAAHYSYWPAPVEGDGRGQKSLKGS